jgi:undecaprenyl-diphosphatase
MRPLVNLIQFLMVLALVVPALHLAFGAYARRRRPGWSEALERRRLAVLVVLLRVVAAIQIGDAAVDGDSGPIDESILWFLHDNVPASMVAFFEAVTLTGSLKVTMPLTAAGTVLLLLGRKRFEALLLAASSIVGTVLVYALKWLVQRERPQLWETATYWGTSFPSGHTVAAAAFATAAALCVGQMRPGLALAANTVSVAWVALVGLSRLVLSVHWPTDVLVAACIGAAVPLTISVAHELRVKPTQRHPGG